MTKHVALITGGAGHIGSQICMKLAETKCDIIIVDKNISEANKLKTSLCKDFGVRAEILSINLMEEKSFGEAADFVAENFGKLDYLVNCAAFYDQTPGWGVPFAEESYEAWIKVLKVNTMAPFFLAQKLHYLMLNSSLASIVNISSIYGLLGPDHSLYEGTTMTNPAAYGVSKGGLQQVTMWLSTVLAPKIRVNTVTSGGIERGQNPVFKDRYEKRTPLKRMATESEIADAVVFLLSEKARYITGQNLVVDGGWSAW